MLEWETPLVIGNDLIERDLGDEIVIMSLDGKEIHSLEKTGLWIWKKIKEKIIPLDIINQLMQEYAVEETLARTDFENFVQSMRDKGIIN